MSYRETKMLKRTKMLRHIIFMFVFILSSQIFAADFLLHSSSFKDKEALQSLYTCDGKNISPELDWTGIPDKTETFALTISDPDAPSGTFYHWVLFNIPKKVLSLREGEMQLPEGIMTAKNSWGYKGYKGPCPPRGVIHHYIITLYALDSSLKLSDGADAASVIPEIQKHILSQATLTTTYQH